MFAMRWPLAGIVVALAAGLGGAVAAPLDEEACKGAKTEREGLVAKGVESDIARGPEWGKANLPPDRLKEVARLIELNEQLTFRCGQLTVARPDGKPLLKKEEPAPKAAGAAGAGKDKKKGADPAAAAADPDPQAKPPAKKKKKAAAGKPADAAGPAPEAGAPASGKAP
jgi:hypothetical protein